MPKTTTNFVCQQCGAQSPSFMGKCPSCGEWNSLVETITQTKDKGQKIKGRKRENGGGRGPIKLSEIKGEALKRVSTGIPELDRVLGGGIVPGMAVLLAGEPGIGKSTLLLQLAASMSSKLKAQNSKPQIKTQKQDDDQGLVLYVAGEESAPQIKIRAERLGISGENLLILEETDADETIGQICQIGLVSQICLIIVDSVQTLTTTDLSGTAGTVGQVRECAARLITAAKQVGIPLFLAGHVTKEGAIAGPKVLEHMVDTVLNIEGDRFSGLRLVRTSKNRFGPADEVGVFTMTEKGLEAEDWTNLSNWSNLSNSEKVGSCLTVAMEGTRPMLCEIQALVTATPVPNPRRVASGVDYNRLLTIVAILQKRLNLPLYKEDIYVSVAGGLKISEPAADLAAALSLISSYHDKPLPRGLVGFGELDLLGNVRKVNFSERRIKEAKARGLTNILSAENLASISAFRF